MSVLLELICVPNLAVTHWAPTLAAVNQVTLWLQMDTLAMVCIENEVLLSKHSIAKCIDIAVVLMAVVISSV